MKNSLGTETVWLEWRGTGEPPTGPLEIRLRDGTEWKPKDIPLDWKHSRLDPANDIIAYRKLA